MVVEVNSCGTGLVSIVGLRIIVNLPTVFQSPVVN